MWQNLWQTMRDSLTACSSSLVISAELPCLGMAEGLASLAMASARVQGGCTSNPPDTPSKCRGNKLSIINYFKLHVIKVFHFEYWCYIKTVITFLQVRYQPNQPNSNDQSHTIQFLSITYHRPGSCTPLLNSSEGHVTPPLLATLRSLTHTWWWTRSSRSEDHCTEHHHLQTGNKWKNTGSPYNS